MCVEIHSHLDLTPQCVCCVTEPEDVGLESPNKKPETAINVSPESGSEEVCVGVCVSGPGKMYSYSYS